MTLTVLTGGARCGKSVAALAAAEAIGVPVVFVATAEAGDDDMARRIERHRAERPAGWTTVEAPRDLGEAVDSANPDTTAAAAVAASVLGGSAGDWVGPGTGVVGAALSHKRDVQQRRPEQRSCA